MFYIKHRRRSPPSLAARSWSISRNAARAVTSLAALRCRFLGSGATWSDVNGMVTRARDAGECRDCVRSLHLITSSATNNWAGEIDGRCSVCTQIECTPD